MKAPQRLEDLEQRALIQWADTQRVSGADVVAGARVRTYLIHIPNGGFRSSTEAAIMKGLGVKRGVSDLFLALPRQGLHGLWIELKRPMKYFRYPYEVKNCVTDAQAMWIEQMLKAGYAAAVCYGWETARTTILGYLRLTA